MTLNSKKSSMKISSLIFTVGFILSLVVFNACNTKTANNSQSDYYTEQFRPQFHFSPEANWMNDPNGMVYLDGEYHLFYQYFPDSTVWGPMHWGHAVSKDLLHWEHLDIGLYPDELGCIFSGSAVYDKDNTSGLGKDGKGPLIAIFTHHNFEGEKAGNNKFQYQSIAYSNDKGRTWTKYKGNPVVPNPGIRDFRDPKVIWHSPSKKWIMSFAAWDHIKFYSSSNLLDWNHESDFGEGFGNHEGVWECPDLFPMQVSGTNETKWVLIVSIGSGGPNGGSATQFFVGDFDGKTFSLDQGFASDVTPKFGKHSGGQVLFDFEKGYGSDWTIVGDAFADAPVQGSYPSQQRVTNFNGLALVNSFYNGDATTGEMLSKAFTIDKNFINLKVGGGKHPKSAYVALVIDGKELDSHTGKNSEKVIWKSWDVRKYRGKSAKIKIVDTATGDWGHILVDEIMLSDQAAIDGPDPTRWVDWGRDNYAGVTWSNVPDERTIFLGWMSNWNYAQVVPSEKWRSAMTLPRELYLEKINASYNLLSRPIQEIKNILGKSKSLEKKKYKGNTTLSEGLSLARVQIQLAHTACPDFKLKFSNAQGDYSIVGFDSTGKNYYIDRTKSGKTEFSEDFAGIHKTQKKQSSNKIDLDIFLDHASIEVFVNGGEIVITDIVFPEIPYDIIELVVDEGEIDVLAGSVTAVKGVMMNDE